MKRKSAVARGALARERKVLMWMGLSMAAVLSSPALADEEAAPATEAQGADIVVTARFREEKLQDVPVAITAISGSRLASAGISQLVQLQFEAPSVSIAIANPRQSSVAIRGLGNNPASDGLSSSVGLYLDGVYLDRPGMGTFDLVDVERIEVLRGPQGTLFGKNTTAGALSVTTKLPSFTPEAFGQVSFGNLGLRQLQLSGSAPLSDSLAVRLSGYVTDRDGYLKNVNLGGSELSLRRKGVRGQVLFKPSDNFSWRLIGEYGKEDDGTSAFVLYSKGPASSPVASFVPYDTWAARLGLTPIFDPYSLTTDQNRHQRQIQRQFAFTSILDVGLGDYTLTSVTGYRDWKFTPFNDFDWSRADVLREQGTINHDKQFSQELRIASPTGSQIDFVAGAYYFHRKMESDNFRTYGAQYSRGLGSGAALNGGTTHTLSNPKSDSFALFGQGTWHIASRIDLTAGLRGTYEKASETVTRLPFTGGTGAPPASLAAYTGYLKISNWSPSALATLSYHANEDLLVYATVSHGEKAGGFNTNVPANGVMASLEVKPEKATNYELGVKSTLLDGRVTLNLSAFLTDVSGYQNNALIPTPTGGFNSQISNIGKVRAKGFEVEASARPFDGLRLGASLAYNDTKYRSFANAPPVQGSTAPTQDLSGQQVVYAPRWNANVNAEFTQPLTSDSEGYVAGDFSYKSGYFGYVDNSSYSRVPGYTITNFRAGVRIDDGRFDLYGFVRNAFDNRYFFMIIPAATGSGGYLAAPSEPRTYGITAAVRF